MLLVLSPFSIFFSNPCFELSFASKGPIIESLKMLDLIESTPDADIFYLEATFEISGSLEELNTDSFSDFFNKRH